jgi:hypothetical protein
MQIYVGGAELSEVTVPDDALTGHVRSSDESGPWHPAQLAIVNSDNSRRPFDLISCARGS